MIVILSPASVASDNVMDEVNSALEDKKRIIPIIYRPCKIPYRLRRLERIDFPTLGYGTGLSRLSTVLQRTRVKRKRRQGPVVQETQPDHAGPAASPLRNVQIWIRVVLASIVLIAVGIPIAHLLFKKPENSTKSPTITIGFAEMGPGKEDPSRYIKKHYGWAKEAIEEELRVFRVSEDGSPPPQNTGGKFIRVLVGCYKTYKADVNEVWVRIDHNGIADPNLPPETYETKGDIDNIREALRERAERIAPVLRARILKAYPLRGHVKEPGGTTGVYLDIGHDAGVFKGDTFEVFKELSRSMDPIQVMVEETEPDLSFAVPSYEEDRSRLSRVRKGWLVRRYVDGSD